MRLAGVLDGFRLTFKYYQFTICSRTCFSPGHDDGTNFNRNFPTYSCQVSNYGHVHDIWFSGYFLGLFSFIGQTPKAKVCNKCEEVIRLNKTLNMKRVKGNKNQNFPDSSFLQKKSTCFCKGPFSFNSRSMAPME